VRIYQEIAAEPSSKDKRKAWARAFPESGNGFPAFFLEDFQRDLFRGTDVPRAVRCLDALVEAYRLRKSLHLVTDDRFEKVLEFVHEWAKTLGDAGPGFNPLASSPTRVFQWIVIFDRVAQSGILYPFMLERLKATGDLDIELTGAAPVLFDPAKDHDLTKLFQSLKLKGSWRLDIPKLGDSEPFIGRSYALPLAYAARGLNLGIETRFDLVLTGELDSDGHTIKMVEYVPGKKASAVAMGLPFLVCPADFKDEEIEEAFSSAGRLHPIATLDGLWPLHDGYMGANPMASEGLTDASSDAEACRQVAYYLAALLPDEAKRLSALPPELPWPRLRALGNTENAKQLSWEGWSQGKAKGRPINGWHRLWSLADTPAVAVTHFLVPSTTAWGRISVETAFFVLRRRLEGAMPVHLMLDGGANPLECDAQVAAVAWELPLEKISYKPEAERGAPRLLFLREGRGSASSHGEAYYRLLHPGADRESKPGASEPSPPASESSSANSMDGAFLTWLARRDGPPIYAVSGTGASALLARWAARVVPELCVGWYSGRDLDNPEDVVASIRTRLRQPDDGARPVVFVDASVSGPSAGAISRLVKTLREETGCNPAVVVASGQGAADFGAAEAETLEFLSEFSIQDRGKLHILESHPHLYGRGWLMAAYERWLHDPKGSSLFFLEADAGMGKTAFSAHLVRTRPEIVASHFCAFDDNRKVNEVAWSFACQIATRFPEFGKAFASEWARLKKIESLPDTPWSIVLNLLPKVSGTPPVLLFDALDEKDKEFWSTVQLAQSNRSGWRVVVTGRRDPTLRQRFAGATSIQLACTDASPAEGAEGFSRENLEDIGVYLRERLLPFATPTDTESHVTRIRDASEGSFLFAKLFCDEIGSGAFRLDSSEVPRGLYDFYTKVLDQIERRAAKENPDRPWKFKGDAAPVLQYTMVAQSPFSEVQLAALSGVPVDEISGRLQPLLKFLSVGSRHLESGQWTYRPFHRSLANWLTDPTRKHEDYFIASEETIHGRLADRLKDAWKDDLKGLG
jgi:hypothetical protein